ncbi:MAG: 16S rRNA (guanine(966)-N(2))-methyltransferase RsmD [Pseudomonadales bacterium]|nr:16S rRNA (guanine(966)-N(2))-methyltransferase RsmD [Pseudomonadales bacterium]
MVRKSAKAKTGEHRLRIIGGEWRGRRIEFAAVDGLRPTGDRIRETLFNWLMAVTPGAHCLDLFAGSGALSFEALSRGAESVTLIDQSAKVTNAIKTQLNLLNCNNAKIINQNGLKWLEQQPADPQQFDIVFLDPPFHKNLLQQSLLLLEEKKLLKPDAMIYIESEVELDTGLENIPPPNWVLHRLKITGQVSYSLYKRESDISAP